MRILTTGTRQKPPRLLLAAFYFPPLGMGGVQRPLKFARYLPDFGWDVTVLTPEPTAYHAADDSLLVSLPPQVEIIRVPWRSPGSVLRRKETRGASSGAPPPWARLAQQWLRWPDDKRGFVRHALRAAEETIAAHRYDAILTTSPPPSLHMLGLRLKRKTGIPWIADFRDPWLVGLNDWGPTALHRSYARRLRRTILRAADTVTAVNENIAMDLRDESPPCSPEVIHNGYDEADFDGIAPSPKSSDAFRVVLYGTLGLPTPPAPVFRLLAAWKHTNSAGVEIHHIGLSLGMDTAAEAERHGLLPEFTAHGYLAHGDSLRHLLSADCLIIPISTDPTYRTTVPGRVFEMLRSQRPILLLAGEHQATRTLIGQIDGVWTASPDNLEEGRRALDRILTLQRQTSARAIGTIARFERKAQTARLAEILDSLIGATGNTRNG